MKNTIVLLSFLFAVVSADTFAKNIIHNSRPDQVVAPVGMNTVVYVDHTLNRSYTTKRWLKKMRLEKINISLEKSIILKNAGGYKEVTAMFRNHTDYDYVLEARTHFFGSDEIPRDSVTRWKRVFIPANSTQVYKTASIDQETAYYRMEVRGAK